MGIRHSKVATLPDQAGKEVNKTQWNDDHVIDAGSINLGTNVVTGTLTVGKGGTGLTAGTAGGLMYFITTATLGDTGAYPTDAVLVGSGAGAPPSYFSKGTSNQVFRVDSTGALGYGSINLASSSAVTGTLPVANGGTGVTTSTGSGNNVLSTSPTLVTPTLGAATATSINFGQNTLQTYQEGTFTPGVSFGNGTTGITYSVQLGHYTKIGNAVVVEIVVILSNKGSSTGLARLTGLPFTTKNVTSLEPPSMPIYSTFAATVTTAPIGFVIENSTVVILSSYQAGGTTNLTNTSFNNTSAINFGIAYLADVS